MPELPKGPSNAWAGDAVHRQPGPSLDGSHAGCRRGTRDAVDGPGVDAARLERHLERGGADVTGS
jgi:hypothetical protein